MRVAYLFTGSLLSAALFAGTSVAQGVQSTPPAPEVAVKASASAICWIPAGQTWKSTIASGAFRGDSGAFSAGTVASVQMSNLVDGAQRASVPSQFRWRTNIQLLCNAPVTVSLKPTHGRFKNTGVNALPPGLTRSDTGSAAFEYSFPYIVDFGLINDVVAGGTQTQHHVNGGTGYRTRNSSGSAAGGLPDWTSADSGSEWGTIRRLDVRITLENPPDVTGQSVRPVMIAGSYEEILNVGLAPKL